MWPHDASHFLTSPHPHNTCHNTKKRTKKSAHRVYLEIYNTSIIHLLRLMLTVLQQLLHIISKSLLRPERKRTTHHPTKPLLLPQPSCSHAELVQPRSKGVRSALEARLVPLSRVEWKRTIHSTAAPRKPVWATMPPWTAGGGGGIFFCVWLGGDSCGGCEDLRE